MAQTRQVSASRSADFPESPTRRHTQMSTSSGSYSKLDEAGVDAIDEGQGTTYDDAGAKGRSDYRLVIDDSQSAPDAGKPSFGLAAPSAGQGHAIEQALTHPAVPVLCYCAASIVMTVVNKFVVSGHQFTMNFLLLAVQSGVCVGCVIGLKKAGVMSYRDFTWDDARKWFPVSFLLVMVIYTGSKSLQYLAIPVYTIFKNLTIILIAYGEVLWFGGHVTGLTLISFSLMVLSSLLAAWSDSTHKVATSPASSLVAAPVLSQGYIWMVINVFVSAAYVLGMRKRIKVTNFKDVEVLYLNNVLSIPVLAIFSVLVEDWSRESLERNLHVETSANLEHRGLTQSHSPAQGRTFLLSAMIFSGAAAVFISYTTAWCVRTTSSTTYSMVGALNKLPVAASGILFFGDPATPGSVSAITVGGLAGIVYAVAKNNQQKRTPSAHGFRWGF